MAIGYLDSTYLTNIGDAIRAKAGTTDSYTVAQMPTAIQNIPSPETPRQFNDVNFFDWDGTILYSYTLEEARALTAMPALPTPPSGYAADSWTETLSYIQNLTMPCDVGVNYSALDSNTKTKVHIEIPYDGAVVVTHSQLGNYLDWGDGSGEQYMNDENVEHTYVQAGFYTITVRMEQYFTAYFPRWPYNGSQGPCFILKDELRMSSTTVGEAPTAKYSLITGVEFGNNAWSSFPQLMGNYKITSLLIPTNGLISSMGASLIYYRLAGTGIKHLTIPSTSNLLNGGQYIANMLKYAPYESIVLPSVAVQKISSIQLDQAQRQGAMNLRRLVVDAGSNTISSMSGLLWDHKSLEEYYVKGSITATPNRFSQGCPNLRKASIIGLSDNSGTSTFADCYSLERVSLPNVIAINDYAFTNSSIKNFDFSQIRVFSNSACDKTLVETLNLNNATAIGYEAFYKCYCLQEVTVGPNVTSIELEAFRYCQNLHRFYIKATTPPTLGIIVFDATASDLVIYVPTGTLAAYQAAQNWSSYADKMQEYSFS